ncbi:MAG: hypothetical protein V1755_04970 [Chloroflexota bacterium]
MSLLTLFAAPKSFSDPQIARIQRNALASWSRLAGVEILLMGEEDGIAEAAARVGARHLKGVLRNDRGTPLISSMIRLARRHAASELLCIINADIIVMQDLLEAAVAVKARAGRFVLLGRRWDIGLDDVLHFPEGWEDRLRYRVRGYGELHRPAGSDFFLFPRDCYAEVPDFAVGRAGWDNWMIYSARRQGWLVVDCTPSVMVVHQNHDYGHLPGGVPHYSIPESDENIRLAGGDAPIRYTVLDATHHLKSGRLVRPPISYARLMRSLELLLRGMFFFLPSRTVEELARPKRWKKRLARLLGKDDAQSGTSG